MNNSKHNRPPSGASRPSRASQPDRRPRKHVSPRTLDRRPTHSLSPELVTRAKELRDEGMPFEEIAERLGSTVRDVELAVMNSRSPNPDSDAASIYTDRHTLTRFLRHVQPGETRHETLVRLIQLAERQGQSKGR